MAGETGETPPEVVAQQVQPKKESAVRRFLNRLTSHRLTSQSEPQVPTGLSGTRTTEQIQKQVGQISTAPEQKQAPTATSEPSEKTPGPLSEVILPSETPPPEGASDWRQAQYEAQQRARGVKTPEQLAEEARIDAENLAKMQVPSRPTEELPKVAPFTQPTTLPEKVFEPQPEIPGEHAGVDEFLKTKPQPTTETPAQPSETATQAPAGETIPVQSQPQEEQPIPVRIPQEEEVPT